jgi:hypothetical protein
MLLSTTLAMLALILLARLAGRNSIETVGILLGTQASMPAWYCLSLGQTSWFFIAFFGAFFLFLITRREVALGAVMVLTAIKAQYAILMVIPMLVCRRFRGLAVAFLLCCVLCAISAQLIGWNNVFNYPITVGKMASSRDLDYAFVAHTLVSLRGPLTVLLPWSVSIVFSAILSVAGLGALIWIWHRAKGGTPSSLLWACALTIVIGLVTSAHSHIYDCLLLSIPAVLTLPALRLEKLLRLESLSLKIWSLLFYFYPLFSLAYYTFHQSLGAFDFLPFTLINIGMVIAGVFYFVSTISDPSRQMTALPGL